MPIYLSEYIGSGAERDPFRPRGSDQPGWAAIDLRPDGGATLRGGGLNRCLLHLPVADSNSRLYQLAEQKGEDLTLTIRAGLAARLNATLNYTRFDDIVADLLLRPPANAWKPLKDHPTKPLAIYLSGLLSPSPALRALAAKSYSETWNAADSASINADLTWDESIGADWAIVSNQVRVTGSAYGYAIAQHDTDTDDQVLTASLITFTRVGGFIVCGLRGRVTVATNDTFYYEYAYNDGATTAKKLEKYVAGVSTELAGNTGVSFSLPEAMRLTMDGSSIGGAIGSTTHGPVTDTAITGVTRAGIQGYSNNVSNLITLDTFNVRDVEYSPHPLISVSTQLRW